ncbi:MAG: DUF1573 domain-containing protein [Bacteroidota bacterium]
MKKLAISFASLLFCSLFLVATLQAEEKGPELKFSKDAEQLGTILVKDLETYKLQVEFTNEGDAPLVLSHVRGCCGTRIKNWPKEPVMPGEEGVIEIEFRLAPRPHKVSRTVTVTSNDPKNVKMFRIYGEVVNEETSDFNSGQQNKAMVPENKQ